MHSLHLPRCPVGLPASSHSFFVRSFSFLYFPHGPQHNLHSSQLLQYRCFMARHALEVKQSSDNHCLQLPKHSLRKPSQDNMVSQCLQNLLPSTRFHWISEKAFLNSLQSHPVHKNEGKCFCSTASQSTLSPRRTCNNKHGPSWVFKINDKLASMFFVFKLHQTLNLLDEKIKKKTENLQVV